MAFEVLRPVDELAIAHIQLLHHQSLGSNLKVHTQQDGLPELDDVSIAIIGIKENRQDRSFLGKSVDFTEVRRAFYELFPGNWHTHIADLGDIRAKACETPILP